MYVLFPRCSIVFFFFSFFPESNKRSKEPTVEQWINQNLVWLDIKNSSGFHGKWSELWSERKISSNCVLWALLIGKISSQKPSACSTKEEKEYSVSVKPSWRIYCECNENPLKKIKNQSHFQKWSNSIVKSDKKNIVCIPP